MRVRPLPLGALAVACLVRCVRAPGAWVQLGGDIDGEAANDQSGGAVALNSADGTRLAVGAQNNDNPGGTDAGHVRVYSWDGSTWSQLGADIDGAGAQFQRSGNAVALSADGSILAVGVYVAGTHRGKVQMYQWSGGAWTRRGADLHGEANGDYMGMSVALSADGTRLAGGAYGNDAVGSNAGMVRVYDWGGTSWNQLGTPCFDRTPARAPACCQMSLL